MIQKLEIQIREIQKLNNKKCLKKPANVETRDKKEYLTNKKPNEMKYV